MRQFPLKNLPYFELFNYSYHKKKPKEIKNEYILCSFGNNVFLPSNYFGSFG
jgi:hypothetical protein